MGDGESCQTRDGVDIELAHEALAMRFDGSSGDVEAGGNFLVAQTFGDIGQDLALSIREFGRVRLLPFAPDQLAQGHASDVGY